ncbi:MAG: N-methyl-L-tryptophan oxidase [Chloroflexia bacterium]|nr:N-methyl-L-tryptophan oxidase [Chloroflexia bacterium]
MNVRRADVIVVGGGTMGTAAGWALAKQGHDVVVLEQFGHVHSMGSHGGKTRIIRHAYAEGADYVPLVQRADALWQELEAATGTNFLIRTGGLDMAAPGFGHAVAARRSALEYDLPHEWLTGAEVNRRWPTWRLPDDWEVCYSPDAGFLEVEPSLRALATEMARHGGELRTEEAVQDWSTADDAISVRTTRGEYRADRLVVVAGSWTGHLLAAIGLPLEVRRKPVFWFKVDDESRFAPDRFPVFIAECADGNFYGLPVHGEPGVKAGVHNGGKATTPDTIDRTPHPSDYEQDLAPFMSRCLVGASEEVVSGTVCMYTMTPDEHFLIDRHPEDPRIVFATGFSGHGFKFAPVIGEHLAALATDEAVQPYADFALSRFALHAG